MSNPLHQHMYLNHSFVRINITADNTKKEMNNAIILKIQNKTKDDVSTAL